MANRIKSGGTSWLNRLSDNRTTVKKELGIPVDAGVAPVPKIQKRTVDSLITLGVPSSVANEHGALFKEVTKDLSAIARCTRKQEAWQQKRLGRIQEQFYKTLGAQLSLLPTPARDQTVENAIKSLRTLTESTQEELTTSCTAAALGIFDSAVRLQKKRTLRLGADEAARLMPDAVASVLELSKAMACLKGNSSAINLFSPLVKQIHLGARNLTPAGLRETCRAVGAFLTEAHPRGGFELATAARLSELVEQATAAHPGDAAKILASAKKAFLEDSKADHDQALAGLDQAPDGIPDGPAKDGLLAAQRALHQMLAASPVGPPDFYNAVDQFRASLGQFTRNAANQPEQLAMLPHLASMVTKAVDSPAAQDLLQHLGAQLQVFSGHPAAIEALGRAAGAAEIPAMTAQLIDAQLAARDQTFDNYPGLKDLLPRLGELPEPAALRVSLSFMRAIVAGKADANLFGALVDYAAEAPDLTFDPFVGRYTSAHDALAGFPQLEQVLLAGIARNTSGDALPNDMLRDLCGSLQMTKQRFPKIELAELSKKNSLLSLVDPQAKYPHPPTQIFAQLIAGAQNAAAGNDEMQRDLVKIAVRIAAESAFIRGGPDLQWPRIVEDWTEVVTNPAVLKQKAQGAVAARANSVAAFLKAHQELPLDFALSAARHLTRDQFGWALNRITTARGRDTTVMLRDFVFGCVQANRLDLVEAIRTSISPPKAISAVIKEVAQNYRTQQMNNVPFDPLLRGLAGGEDPVGILLVEQTKLALAGLNLEELAEGKLDPEGVQEIMSLAPNIAELLTQYTTAFKSMDHAIDMGKLREPFLACLKSVAQGTWPTPKYEDEIAKRQLAILTPEQQAIWRQTTITADPQQAVVVDNKEFANAMPLMRGVSQLLSKEVKLGGPGLGDLGWDEASAEKLRQMRDEAIGQLRETQKGSAEHRKLSGKLTHIRKDLGIIELHNHLTTVFQKEGVEPRSVLLAARSYLRGALPGLRKKNRGLYRAAHELNRTASTIKSSPREGHYAADEDGLTHMIASHKSGCLSFGDHRRRWGLCGSLSDANAKMMRTYHDDQQVYRAFLRLFQVKFDGYEGPALYVEGPYADGGGNNSDRDLLWLGAMEKGRAMGIPVILTGAPGNVPEGWQRKNLQITFTMDYGHTGVMHSDALGQQTDQNRDVNWTFNSSKTIMVPPQ